MSERVIIVENLGKKYSLRHQKAEPYTALRDVLSDKAKSLFRKRRGPDPTREEFWALKGVSFEVEKGEVVGIIGRNGAGKSTLLKILSRITEPTEGRVRVKGRVASLLEVGTGFHPELTGRENIFLNGAILGMARAEIKAKFDEIVAFAEVERFLDTPVKRYSSGMYVRLAFAVAAHLEPEILIIDEVLAVGDAGFQKKCLAKMGEAAGSGRTVLFVSHNLGTIQTLCARAVLLHSGRVVMDSLASDAVRKYLLEGERSASHSLAERKDRQGTGESRLIRASAVSRGEGGLSTGQPAQFEFTVDRVRSGLGCSFTIYDQLGVPLTHFNTRSRGRKDMTDGSVRNTFVCSIEQLLLVPGHYRINVALSIQAELIDHLEDAIFLDVGPGDIAGRSSILGTSLGSIVMPHSWTSPSVS